MIFFSLRRCVVVTRRKLPRGNEGPCAKIDSRSYLVAGVPAGVEWRRR